MPILRIKQRPGSAKDSYRLEVQAEDIAGSGPETRCVEIEFALSPQDRERVRWYLEDFLLFDQEPAPQIAKQVEDLMAERGEALFSDIFGGSSPANELWTAVQPQLSSTRIEVTTGIADAMAIPWELIRDPETKAPLALSAKAFVRAHRDAAAALAPQQPEARKVRILLVICRPKGGEDVPFRSVAGQLVTRLSEEARGAFDLDVLRPPTFDQLAATLHNAKSQAQPYQIVHFDGHGTYRELVAGARPRGYLVFEGEQPGAQELIHGKQIGQLLSETDVPVLVLNACQSAYAETQDSPRSDDVDEGRTELVAYGSFAQETIDAGTPGVVAMRYSVYVVTMAQFVAELYGALARGRVLGEAVTWARENLAKQPERRIAYDARPLQDWSVPVVWERAPLRLWPAAAEAAPTAVLPQDAPVARQVALDETLPERPVSGFYGRDETLHALDRAFDSHSIVLLHAYAGSGKTATAAEFGRWYALTGGVEGAVLFSSFERHLPLARLLDKIGEFFGGSLESAGVQWDAITDTDRRRNIALQILEQVPVLWIFDNIESVAGVATVGESGWSAEERGELHRFLSDVRETKAKVLLTSRRDEEDWLGELAQRVTVPPMPMQERLQLAGAIAERRGERLADLPDLAALLRFTQGNPLTILVTVGEVLRSGIDTKERLDAFVDSLRSGQAALVDEATEGRSRSLSASLSYGFEHAFDESERKVLALLHLFQGFVDVDALQEMGDPDQMWCLEAVRALTAEQVIALLDRAAAAGLLSGQGGGCYRVHPALPWYFRSLFEDHYPAAGEDAEKARCGFVYSIAAVANAYHHGYGRGERGLLLNLAAEEDNMLAAWSLAREHGWWRAVVVLMQGLSVLYNDTGRGAAWRRLVQAVVPDFVEPETNGPLPGREEEWDAVTQYRVRLAQEDRDLAEAERLQRMLVERYRVRAQPALQATPDNRDDEALRLIRNLAVTLEALAETQRLQGDPTSVDALLEALEYCQEIGDTAEEAACAYNLGVWYQRTSDTRDLEEAERWYKHSLGLQGGSDRLGRAKCLDELGSVVHDRWREARAAGKPDDQIRQLLDEAAKYCEKALSLFPESAVNDLATAHYKRGQIYVDAGEEDHAMQHYQRAIRYFEDAGNTLNAGHARLNGAFALLRAARAKDARAYAEAAIANYRSFGDRAAAYIEKAEELIANAEQQSA